MSILAGKKDRAKTKFEMNRIFSLNEPNAPRLNPALAIENGLNESILFLQVEYWLAVSNNEREGRRWTYQSLADMKAKAFPFWSTSTIWRAVESLKKQNLITVSNFNEKKFDKTCWFAINFEEAAQLKSVSVVRSTSETRVPQNEIRVPQSEIRGSQNEMPIPETTTEITADITPQNERNAGEEKAACRNNLSLVEVLPPESETAMALLDLFGGMGGAASVAELAALVDSGRYSIEDVRGCKEWIITYFQFIPASPASVIQYLPTYVEKRDRGRLEPWQAETPSEKLTREWSDPRRDQDLARDFGFGRHRRAMK